MKPTEFEAMLEMDERHWWYRGRRRVLSAVLDGLELPPGAKVLDAGLRIGPDAGDAEPVRHSARAPSSTRSASKPLGAAAYEVEEAVVEALPYEDGSFDLVTCLDVIEHTDDDVKSLQELRRVTKPDGHLIVTVPAHPRLWSNHDVVNLHRRRYTRRSLRASGRGQPAGRSIGMTGFNLVYLAPAALVRLARAAPPGRRSSELTLTPPSLNQLLEMPLRLEATIVRRGLNLPTGLSLLALVR